MEVSCKIQDLMKFFCFVTNLQIQSFLIYGEKCIHHHMQNCKFSRNINYQP